MRPTAFPHLRETSGTVRGRIDDVLILESRLLTSNVDASAKSTFDEYHPEIEKADTLMKKPKAIGTLLRT